MVPQKDKYFILILLEHNNYATTNILFSEFDVGKINHTDTARDTGVQLRVKSLLYDFYYFYNMLFGKHLFCQIYYTQFLFF